LAPRDERWCGRRSVLLHADFVRLHKPGAFHCPNGLGTPGFADSAPRGRAPLPSHAVQKTRCVGTRRCARHADAVKWFVSRIHLVRPLVSAL
jgi:hypothetical protein